MPKFTEAPAQPSLDEIAAYLGEVYFIEKDAKAERENYRGKFFEAATATFSPEKLAQKTVVVPQDVQTEEARAAYARTYNVGWEVVSVNDDGVVIREDPALKPYQIIVPVEGLVDSKKNPQPGYSISRSVASGSLTLDEERIMALDFDLYLRVTIVANYDLLYRLLYQAGAEVEAIDKRLDESSLPRVLRSLDDLSDEDRAEVQQYTYEGPRQVKLLVRYAKEEEIGEG